MAIFSSLMSRRPSTPKPEWDPEKVPSGSDTEEDTSQHEVDKPPPSSPPLFAHSRYQSGKVKVEITSIIVEPRDKVQHALDRRIDSLLQWLGTKVKNQGDPSANTYDREEMLFCEGEIRAMLNRPSPRIKERALFYSIVLDVFNQAQAGEDWDVEMLQSIRQFYTVSGHGYQRRRIQISECDIDDAIRRLGADDAVISASTTIHVTKTYPPPPGSHDKKHGADSMTSIRRNMKARALAVKTMYPLTSHRWHQVGDSLVLRDQIVRTFDYVESVGIRSYLSAPTVPPCQGLASTVMQSLKEWGYSAIEEVKNALRDMSPEFMWSLYDEYRNRGFDIYIHSSCPVPLEVRMRPCPRYFLSAFNISYPTEGGAVFAAAWTLQPGFTSKTIAKLNNRLQPMWIMMDGPKVIGIAKVGEPREFFQEIVCKESSIVKIHDTDPPTMEIVPLPGKRSRM